MNAEDQQVHSPNQPKSRSGPQCLSLSRCSSCYNQQRNSRLWHQRNGESSSSAEDSGPEMDCESETESSSSGSVKPPSETLEEPQLRPASEGGGKDGDGQQETAETEVGQEDKSKAKTRRLSLVRSYTLPTHFSPRLIPLALLPRPHSVVSTLHLEVVSQSDAGDSSYIFKQHKEKTEAGSGGGWGGVNHVPPPPQPPLQQHHLSHQHQPQPHHLSHQHQPQPHHLSYQHQPQPHHLSYQYQPQPHHLSHQHEPQPHHLSHQHEPQPHHLSYQYQPQPHHLSYQHQPHEVLHHHPQHIPPISALRLPPSLHIPPPQAHPFAPPCWCSMYFPHSPYWTHYG